LNAYMSTSQQTFKETRVRALKHIADFERMISAPTNDSLDIDESQEVLMNQSVHNGKLFMIVTLSRCTQRVRKIASVSVLIILAYIVMLFVSAFLPQ